MLIALTEDLLEPVANFSGEHPLQNLAVYLIVGAEKGISINQIRYTIGVSYKTAWYLCHRIRAALLEVDMRLMRGMREANEMLLGGEVEDQGIRYRANKTLFDAANSTKTTQSSRDIVECCPQIQAELLDTYLNELRYRFNNRANPYMLRDALWKLIIVGNLPY